MDLQAGEGSHQLPYLCSDESPTVGDCFLIILIPTIVGGLKINHGEQGCRGSVTSKKETALDQLQEKSTQRGVIEIVLDFTQALALPG